MASTESQITLRPATLQDRRQIYDWLTHSDSTSSMMGPPDFPDVPIPTWEEFIEDYTEHFFSASKPEAGCCYVIERDGEALGQINHNAIVQKATELDIWLRGEDVTGKGYGSQAISLMCEYLFKTQGCHRFIIAPSRRNKRAVRAYSKAGFVESPVLPVGFIADSNDSLVMILEFQPELPES